MFSKYNQHHPAELPVIGEFSWVCIIPRGNNQPHVDVDYLKRGKCGRKINLILIYLNLNILQWLAATILIAQVCMNPGVTFL